MNLWYVVAGLAIGLVTVVAGPIGVALGVVAAGLAAVASPKRARRRRAGLPDSGRWGECFDPAGQSSRCRGNGSDHVAQSLDLAGLRCRVGACHPRCNRGDRSISGAALKA